MMNLTKMTESMSKKQIRERMSQILNRDDIAKPLSDEEQNFVMEVLMMHPRKEEKIGKGVSNIYVWWNKKIGTVRSFWIKRIDGSICDFSYLKCLGEKGDSTDFQYAFREAIAVQVENCRNTFFGKRQERRCPITGKDFHKSQSHVDHVAPNTFSNLLKTFLESEGGYKFVRGVFDNNTRGQMAGILHRWRIFHGQNATLRVLSVEGHDIVSRSDNGDR